ncbi:MAG: hypothetical protein IJU37_10540 [Desulfovibrio sp.]|nr:hypothetical protein [Desulfovibrio sp.]
MPELNFSKWSPGGNTTLLFPSGQYEPQEQARLATSALDATVLGGEQAGFFDGQRKILRMAGGEFCVNASRAMGALLAWQNALPTSSCPASDDQARPQYEAEIVVSGWPTAIRLLVRGQVPLWQVAASLRLPPCPVEHLAADVRLVRLPGICHLLLNAPFPANPDHCLAAAARLRKRYHLDDEPAAGVVWWRNKGPGLEMLPVVHVRDTHSACVESACGSGALALALTQEASCVSILQPSGSTLVVRLRATDTEHLACIDGPVRLLAWGSVWLPEATVLSG